MGRRRRNLGKLRKTNLQLILGKSVFFMGDNLQISLAPVLVRCGAAIAGNQYSLHG